MLVLILMIFHLKQVLEVNQPIFKHKTILSLKFIIHLY